MWNKKKQNLSILSVDENCKQQSINNKVKMLKSNKHIKCTVSLNKFYNSTNDSYRN